VPYTCGPELNCTATHHLLARLPLLSRRLARCVLALLARPAVRWLPRACARARLRSLRPCMAAAGALLRPPHLLPAAQSSVAAAAAALKQAQVRLAAG
jgi:hypothetical protein